MESCPVAKLHKELLAKGIKVSKDLEGFLDTIDLAVERFGEGMKIKGGTPREQSISCTEGVRFQGLLFYLYYLGISEKDYNSLVAEFVGEKVWKSWHGLRFAYRPEATKNPILKKYFAQE